MESAGVVATAAAAAAAAGGDVPDCCGGLLPQATAAKRPLVWRLAAVPLRCSHPRPTTQLNGTAKKIKIGAASRSLSEPMDPAFKVVPRGCTCFLVWRIESFQLVPVPADQYGCFFDGDSYLILAVLQHGELMASLTQVKEVRGNNLDIRIHFWLGENTTQDESATAAMKAVELDDYLGGTPVQYREVQGRESAVFLNYFKKTCGINVFTIYRRYAPGGCASGFSHVDYTIKPRLLHVKGKHCPRMREVSIAWSSMNEGDVFILDVGDVLFLWNGKSSSRIERIKALDYARKLRDDRGGSNVVIVDDGEENAEQMGEEAFQVFDGYLPSTSRSETLPALNGGADGTAERKAQIQLKLWRCSEEGSQLKLTEVAHAPLTKQHLDSNDCYILDNGEDGVWVWCGRNASKREKQEGMNNAAAFVMQRNYASHVQLTKVYEGGEPAEFKSLFTVWERERLPGQTKASVSRIAQTTVQTRFDAATMHDCPQVAMETGMVDDGSGDRKIWRVERGRDGTYGTVELERKYIGQLYGGDSYVILYTYFVNKRETFIIYYWLGKKSTQDEMGVAALKAVELDDSLGGVAKQVRVVHGKEPNHFLAMFGGRLVIFAGGKAGWGSTHQQDEGPGDTYLLHVRGTAAYNTKAEQVPCRAESLNSNDVFVLFSKSGVFVWAGKCCTGDEREMAKQIAGVSPRGYHMMTEGQEKDEFWNAIGGKGDYSSTPRLQVECESRPPRIFHCSNASGSFHVIELLDFTQQDLLPEDVFLLDSYNNIYVWLGQDARPEEKTMTMDAALDYVEADPSGRPKGTPIFVIKQGLEPPDFIGYFGVWDRDLWSNGKTYEEMKEELGQKNVPIVQVRPKSMMNGETSFSELAKYPYQVLCQKKDLPEGLDMSHKEKHLSNDEFLQIFGTTYAEFVGLPLWKQQQMKKQCHLF